MQYYHIYNRGAHKSKVFIDDKDYLFFLKRLGQYKKKHSISILSYVLMPNHFHLFAMEKDNATGKLVSDLTNSYTKAFNKRHGHSGVIFQGPTNRKIIKNEQHLMWITKYILLNPVKAKLAEKPHDWKYSSAGACLMDGNDILVDLPELWKLFQSKKQFEEFIFDKKDGFDYNVLF